jgi:hypothetical protein
MKEGQPHSPNPEEGKGREHTIVDFLGLRWSSSYSASSAPSSWPRTHAERIQLMRYLRFREQRIQKQKGKGEK